MVHLLYHSPRSRPGKLCNFTRAVRIFPWFSERKEKRRATSELSNERIRWSLKAIAQFIRAKENTVQTKVNPAQTKENTVLTKVNTVLTKEITDLININTVLMEENTVLMNVNWVQDTQSVRQFVSYTDIGALVVKTNVFHERFSFLSLSKPLD